MALQLTSCSSLWIAQRQRQGAPAAALSYHSGAARLLSRHAAVQLRQLDRTRTLATRKSVQTCRAAADADGLARKYSAATLQDGARRAEQKGQTSGGALFTLILINLIVYGLDHVLKQGWVPLLYLNHQAPRLWQWITCAFCHGSWQHLSSNLFGLYVFGREVENDGGGLGVVLTYLTTALGASIASYFFLPRASLSLGASGAVFGFYMTSVLLKFASGLSLKKLVEAVILGQFVYSQVQQEFVKQAGLIGSGSMVGSSGVSHIAHLAGAAAGVLLIAAISRLPGGDE